MKIFGKNIPKWGVYGGVGAVVVGGVYLWKKRSSSSSTSGSSAIDPVTGLPYSEDNQTDPLTGLTYLAEAQQYGSVAAAESALSGTGTAGLAAQEASQAATEGTTAATTGVTSTTTSQGAGFASNSQWSQAAEQYLTGTVGLDPGTVSGALGVYLQGGALSASQASIVQQAIAAEGDPPVAGSGGFPPSLNTGSPNPSSSGSSSSSSTPSTGSGSASTSKTFAYNAPAGLKASSVTSTSALLTWDAVTAKDTSPASATTTAPTGYTVAVFQTNGKQVWNQVVTGTQTTVTGLHSSWTYHANVWANGGPKAPPHSTATFTCTK